MITFDGHHDVLWHAPGLLHSLHMPATAYIDSKRTLEQHLGHPVQWFAYPDGRENPAVVALALKAGSVVAVTTQPGSTQSAQAPLTLHRYEVLDTTGVDGVADFVRGS